MSVKIPCPDREALHQLLLGRAPADVELLYCHLEECDRCTEAARSLGGDDWLPAALRSLAGAGPPDADAFDLVESLRRKGPPRPDSSSNDEHAAEAVTASGGPTPGNTAADGSCFDFLGPAQDATEMGRLGGYRVLGVLGRGGMGVVFRAEDPVLRRPVALKAMLPGLAAGDSSHRRFLCEGRSAAAASHDHIIPIYQVGEDRGVPFIAMPLLSGESLEYRLRREKTPSPTEVVHIGREIAEGLAAAHALGLIHRDVKPANVWLETPPGEAGAAVSGGRVKILDFGLVRDAGDPQVTAEGVVVGTPAYMAPEQANGEEVDARADLFALGCVLYRMATGDAPFKGKDSLATLLAVARDAPAPPSAVNPAVPCGLSDLILRMLCKHPAGRPVSARAVADALEALATAEGTTGRLPPEAHGPSGSTAHSPPCPWRPRRRRPPRRRRRTALPAAGSDGGGSWRP